MRRVSALVFTLCLLGLCRADAHSMAAPGPGDLVSAGSDTGRWSASRQSTDIYRNNSFKKRLESIQKDVQLDYNEFVQLSIDSYLSSSGREDISRELGLADYYFPIYEKIFREVGIPDEIKYLSIVESQLNPCAVSRVGATGPWQFMTNTARIYGLKMDDYVDERRDPLQSTYAAAAYLKDAYDQFGDWLLAIASYNCGKSNVLNAIEKAGASDYWSIRPYLPAETRGYVPAYIAVTYVMNYYRMYHILPQQSAFAFSTDTVMVDKYVTLSSISQKLGLSLAHLVQLNPSYTQLIINGTPESPKVLVLPRSAKMRYTTLSRAPGSGIGAITLPGFDWDENDRRVERRVPVHRKLRKFESLTVLQGRTGPSFRPAGARGVVSGS